MKSLRTPATIGALTEVGAFVIRVAREAGLDSQSVYSLRLAVEEIATNAIVHGYGEVGQEGELVVTAEVTVEAVVITLQDSSPPYDPRQTPPPEVLDQPLEKRPAGGLGVYLALQNVDGFEYAFENGLNCHTFVMNRTN